MTRIGGDEDTGRTSCYRLPSMLYAYTVVSSPETDMHASLRQIYRPRRDPLPHWIRMLWSWL